MVGKVVRSLGCGGGYTSSTRQRGVSIMGEFMSTIQYNTIQYDSIFEVTRIIFWNKILLIYYIFQHN